MSDVTAPRRVRKLPALATTVAVIAVHAPQPAASADTAAGRAARARATTLRAWGDNERYTQTRIGTASDWKIVSTGNSHTVGIRA